MNEHSTLYGNLPDGHSSLDIASDRELLRPRLVVKESPYTEPETTSL